MTQKKHFYDVSLLASSDITLPTQGHTNILEPNEYNYLTKSTLHQ